ncbi:MAG: nitrilase-related carbon-nitrogen hydrolase [Candidatus Berkiella sp.]
MTTIACVQYAIENLATWQDYVHKVTQIVLGAKENGAQLVLMPEYAGIEVITKTVDNDAQLFEEIQHLLPLYLALFQELAKTYQLYIQSGTILVKTQPGRYANRAYFFSPNGDYGYQDKINLVTNEHQNKLITPGDSQTIFDTELGLIGIAVCYDSEFPELIRNYSKAGVKLILVPSYTASMHSFNRVYFSCKARALENQCYLAMSCMVGEVKFGQDLDDLVGQATIFTPIDVGFKADGILAQGNMNQTNTIIEKISFRKIEQVRAHGEVRNFNDFVNSKNTYEVLTQKL